MTLHRGDPIDLDSSNNGATPKGRRLGSLVGRSGTGTHRVGVLVDSMAPVVTGSGAGMSYNVRACAVVAKHSDANGPTISALDAVENIAVADDGSSLAAPGSNSRIDVIYAVQDLVTSDGGATVGGAQVNTFRVLVRKGTAAASPSIPSIASVSGAIPLMRATVPSSATNTSGLTFTQIHDWVTANGGLVPKADGSREFEVWNGAEQLSIFAGASVQGLSASDAMRKGARTLLIRAASATANGNGDASITFDTPFPTGVIAAIPVDSVDITNVSIGMYTVRWNVENTTNTTLTFRYLGSGGPVAGLAARTSWIVWGY